MGKTIPGNILVLVADDAENVRQFIADVLQNHGFYVIQAIDTGTAIKVVEEWEIDAAVISHRLKPNDGFEVAEHVLVKEHRTGVIMTASDPSSDLLLRAGELGIGQVLRKPVDPARLVETVRRVVRALGKNPDALTGTKTAKYSHDDIMKRVLTLANQNARANMGGPFAAIVVDEDGNLLGEGVNGVQVRCDPTAHAEVLAIRRATEKLKKPRLDGCVIYCSTEPTMMGEALIIGTGISKVYYGISHEEAGTPRAHEMGIIGEIAKPVGERIVPHEQLQRDQAMEVFQTWQSNKPKLAG